ncbi:MAG: flagellar hook protein FlgE [Acidovorax sp.]
MGFQQGLSGLSASSKSLDVIGNNIANSNTTGFKASRTEFANMVASAFGTAGNNAGIGVSVADIAQQFTQGNISTTGSSTDLAINGNGFFAVQKSDGTMAYTRAGNFQLDKSGDLVTPSGANVMGYTIDPTTGLRTSATLVPMSFPLGKTMAAKQTATASFTGNLDARVQDATATTPPTPRQTYATSINVYDSQGVAVPVNMYFVKNGSNTWDVYDQLDDPTATPPVTASPVGQLVFDGNGNITSGSPLALTVTPQPTNPNTPPTPFTVDVNLDNMTQYGTKFAINDAKQDGYTAGQLTNINVGNDGKITATYSNGVSQAEGQVALASFANNQGLADVGNNLFMETSASGQAVMGTAGTGIFGELRSGALEDSNVDLTAELVNMMTAQRAYQANAQTIKTQDQIMSTIVNLR